MAYIGKTPSQAVRSRYFYTAAGGETSLSGADDNGDTLIFADGNYVDVYLNGVLLVASSDYNVNTVNTIAGLTALTASDIVEIVVYDTFSVFGGVFQGDLSADTITGDMFGSHQFKAKNIEGSTIPKGTPVYIAGHSGNDPEIAIADADDPAKMPAFGITTAAIANNNKGDVIVFGNYIGLDTSGFSVGDELYVSNTGTLVNTRPSASADKVQKIAKVIRSQSQNGQIFVMGAGRSNDVPNAITTNSINLGSTTTVSSVLDEDTMTSDSATALATQQSIKAYVDSQIGSNNELSEILTNGNTTGGNDISFGDNDKAVFGASSDLQVYHDGSNSYIYDGGAGNLIIKATDIRIRTATDENYITATQDGALSLYYDNATKLATTATGVNVTGTVAATSYTGDGSALTGIPTPTLTSLGIANHNDITVDGSGNVGIATSVPTHNLTVGNTAASDFVVALRGGVGGFFGWDDSANTTVLQSPNTRSLSFQVNSDTFSSGTEAMRIDTSGNVGIGTSSPRTVLDLGTSRTLKLRWGTAGSLGELENLAGDYISNNVYPSSESAGTITYTKTVSDNGNVILQDYTYGIRFFTGVTGSSGSTGTLNNFQRVSIDSSGNVGIGDSAPSQKLNVAGNIMLEGSDQFLYLTNVGTGNSGIYVRGITADSTLRSHSTGMFTWEVTGSEKMRIDSNGSLLYGTTSNVGTGSLGVAIDAGDNFMIRHGVSGTATQHRMRFYNSNGLVGYIQTSGSSTSYVTSSDYRLKTDVTYDWDATSRLKQLKPARFEWIADGDDAVPVDGFLAHEVQSVVPEAITGTHNEVDDEGNPVYQGIDQSKLVPLLVKTIQELEARITALETA